MTASARPPLDPVDPSEPADATGDPAWAAALKRHRAGDFLGQPYLLIRPIPDWHAPWWLALDCRDNTYRAVLEAGPEYTRLRPLIDADLYLLPEPWPDGPKPRLYTLPLSSVAPAPPDPFAAPAATATAAADRVAVGPAGSTVARSLVERAGAPRLDP
ncbi:MAG: hypothetical protein ACREJ2_19180, partial [Planctomycetota bacterium]